MKRRLLTILLGAALCLLLWPLAAVTAHAQDYDEIVNYDIVVAPDAADGSLAITATFDWKMLESLDYGTELKVGIPNGSMRDVTALTDSIERLEHDNSYMYVYLTRAYAAGEVEHFSFSWVQEYMYELGEDGSVSYDYTPGWFDEALVDHMSVTWQESGQLDGQISYSADDDDCWTVDGLTLLGTDLPYGSQVNLYAVYDRWPVSLGADMSRDNLPEEDWNDYYYEEDDGVGEMIAVTFLVIIILVVGFIIIAANRDGYSGGFGTRYVYVGNLWYPAGPDGRPRPGSVGTPTKPKPPAPRSGSGGFGGGSRGGGFGGGGFGGGGHCACASSCACACACACAGGGRAGCSAKNLYGAVHLDEQVTAKLENRE